MLNVMRENLRHLKWVLWAVAIAMVASLGYMFNIDWSGRQQGVREDWAAIVNDEAISTRVFIDTTRNADNYYRNLLGDQYNQLKPSLALGTQVMQSLITEQVMLQEAGKMGLSASQEEISKKIFEFPGLSDAEGNFVGAERYKQIIERNPQFGGLAGFESNLADDIILGKWRDLATSSVSVSDSEIEEAFRLSTEKSAIKYVLLPLSEENVSQEVSDQELAAWYETHQDDFMMAERRSFRYVVIDRETRMEQMELTDQDIQDYYSMNTANYSHPEQRRGRHILFNVPPEASETDRTVYRRQAESVLKRVRDGEDFALLAKAMSQDPGSAGNGGDLGFVSRGRMVPPFEEALFNTPVGELADVVETDFGFHVLEVTDARPAGTVPLQEVRDDIERTLRIRRAHDEVRTEAERIAGLLEAAADLDTVAGQEGFEVNSRTVSREDNMADLAPSPEFLGVIFDLEPGQVSPPVGLAAGMAVLVLDDIIPPSVATLDEVRDRVLTAVLNDRGMKSAVNRAGALLSRHDSIDGVARALGKDAEDSGDLAPGRIVLPGAGGPSPELRKALFADDTAVGDRNVVQVQAGAVAYEITRRVHFDPEALEQSRDGLGRELLDRKRSVLMEGIMGRLMDRYEVQVNQPLVEQFNK